MEKPNCRPGDQRFHICRIATKIMIFLFLSLVLVLVLPAPVYHPGEAAAETAAIGDGIPAGTATIPAPWDLTGDGFIVLLRMPTEILAERAFTPSPLVGREAGGLSILMFVDYRSSNVGPYRELLYIPGKFRFGDKSHWSITRIFVSSWESVVSGRKNWGIPKDRADFQIEAGTDNTQQVRVSKNGHTFAQFALKPRGVGLPIRTWLLPRPFRMLGHQYQGDYYTVAPSGKGTLRLASLQVTDIDPACFPDISRGHVVLAVSISNFHMRFPVAGVTPAQK